MNEMIFTHLPLLSFNLTHVDLPQNGVKSHDLPGSTVAHRVDAKHISGKSEQTKKPEKKRIDIIF